MTSSTEQLILSQLRDLNKVVREDVAAIHTRINPIEAWQKAGDEKFKSMRSRINWLYFIVGGLVVGGGVAVVTQVLARG